MEITSLSVAFLISIRLFDAIALVGFSSTMLHTAMMLIFAVILGVGFLMNLMSPKEKRSIYMILVITVLVIYYLFYMITGEKNLSPFQFLLYCVIPLCVSSEPIDTEKMLRYVVYGSIFSFPVLENMMGYQYKSLQQIDMATAYALFIGVAASVVHFIYYKEKRNVVVKICYLYNIYILVRIFISGNRGIYVSVIGMLIFMQMTYMHRTEIPQKKRRLLKIVMTCEVVIGLVLYLNIEAIILGVYELISSAGGFIPSFIIKMRRQILAGDISNGRWEVFIYCIKKILENPLGYGVEASARISNGLFVYPHNFILQLFLEFGVILGSLFAMVVCMPWYKLILKKNSNTNNDIQNYVLFLSIVTIPKLLISGDIWMQPQFWLMFGLGVEILLTNWKKQVLDYRLIKRIEK